MIEELNEEMANDNGAQKEAAPAQPAERSFPRKYQEILQDFGASIDTSSPATVLSELGSPGIFDQPKKRRYWVDKEGNNCFMVYARALSITLGEDSRYWHWYPETATSHVSVDVAEMLDLCTLKVEGDFETGYLTPETVYEVSFVIMLKDPTYGWEDEVDFSLILPQNPSDPIIRKCDMRRYPKGRWTYIRVGEFTPSHGQSDRMKFMLREIGRWRKGLVIKGVDISPKLQSTEQRPLLPEPRSSRPLRRPSQAEERPRFFVRINLWLGKVI